MLMHAVFVLAVDERRRDAGEAHDVGLQRPRAPSRPSRRRRSHCRPRRGCASPRPRRGSVRWKLRSGFPPPSAATKPRRPPASSSSLPCHTMPSDDEVLHPQSHPPRLQLSPPLAAGVAQSRAEAGLRRGHRRRRRPRPRHRLLPRQGARHHQRRRAREGLARRRQHRPQHHHHPLQLPVRRKRGALRARAEALGGAVAGAELQRHVLAARRDDARAQHATTCRASSATSMPTG